MARLSIFYSDPHPETVERMLNNPTRTHRVALESAYRFTLTICRVAAVDDFAADIFMDALVDTIYGGDIIGALSRPLRHILLHIWQDEVDSHPDCVGRDTMFGFPQGIEDIARGATLVACSILGVIEPPKKYAEIIADWYTGLCLINKTIESQGAGENGYAAMLNDFIETSYRWPADPPTAFLHRLDQIAENTKAEGLN